eukprot:434636-Prymnesium_polylepis.1
MRRVYDQRVCYHRYTDRTSGKPGSTPGSTGSTDIQQRNNACSRNVPRNVPISHLRMAGGNDLRGAASSPTIPYP